MRGDATPIVHTMSRPLEPEVVVAKYRLSTLVFVVAASRRRNTATVLVIPFFFF
jgi:tryptophan-rich sensory protein